MEPLDQNQLLKHPFSTELKFQFMKKLCMTIPVTRPPMTSWLLLHHLPWLLVWSQRQEELSAHAGSLSEHCLLSPHQQDRLEQTACSHSSTPEPFMAKPAFRSQRWIASDLSWELRRTATWCYTGAPAPACALELIHLHTGVRQS